MKADATNMTIDEMVAHRRQSRGPASSRRDPSASCASGSRIDASPLRLSHTLSSGKKIRPVIPAIPTVTPSHIHDQPSSDVASRMTDNPSSANDTPMSTTP